MGDLEEIFKIRKVNIVKDPRWKSRWDADSGKLDWVDEAAWNDFSAMSKGDLAEKIMEMAEVGIPWQKYLKFSEEDAEAIADRIQDYESVHMAISDTFYHMYEEAAIPGSADINGALYDAQPNFREKDLGEHWDLVASEKGPPERSVKNWQPGGEKFFSFRNVLIQLGAQIRYDERVTGGYDRYLLFTFGEAEAVKILVRAISSLPPDQAEENLHNLRVELDEFKSDFVDDFFKYLVRSMEEADMSNRADWRKAWKDTLLNLKEWHPGVKKEILEYMKGVA